ncbi:MAG: hypothetical protein JWQ74_3707, partial [Marmoricola sp.]|nr:hypothetical protein [Marmoricola sp.]
SVMADIFLSYNEADREAVRRLSLALQSVGWSVWWDRRIPAGQTWRSVLSRELQNMRCMVVVWSATSVASEWVCEEAAEGRQSGKLIPVMIEPVRPPAGFRELQAADLIGWDGDEDFPGFQQLIEDIGRLIYVPEKPSQTGTPSQPFPLSEADQHSSAAAAPIKPAPPPVNPHDRWLWIGAGGALLAAMGTGFFAEHWRQRSLVQPPAPMAEAPAVPPATSKAVATGASGVLPGTATKSIVADMPGRGEMKPGTTTATTAADTPPKSATKRPSATNPRCAALQERQQLGETLSATSQRILQQEC